MTFTSKESSRCREARLCLLSLTMGGVVPLMGCTASPLDQVAIVGATHSEEVAIRAEISAATDALDLRGVRLHRIAVKDHLRQGVSGRYSTTRQISLARTDEGSMRAVLRHELCHALDLQSGLRASSNSELIDVFWEIAAEQGQDDSFYTRDVRKAQEAFADFCAFTPEGLLAIQTDRGSGNDAVTNSIDWFFERVAAQAPSRVQGLTWLAPGEWAPPERPALFDGDVLVLVYDDEHVYLNAQGDTLDLPPEGTAIGNASGLTEYWQYAPVIPGEHVGYGQTESGVRVAFIRPTLAERYHLFVAAPGELWAWHGPTTGMPWLWETKGTVVAAWTNDAGEFVVVRYE